MWIWRCLNPGTNYVYGPFKTADAAAKWAAKENLTAGWVLQKLMTPYKN